ncbi:MAG: hypothetical protein HMLIMOIP_000246 [Candidatus Nitrosomirales archaeon]|jgi:hypothetical protein
MGQLGQKTVTLSGKILRELQKEFDKEVRKRPSLSFAGFISEYAMMELERKKIVTQTAPISLIGFQDDKVILKDARRDRFAEVQIKDKKMKCLLDDKTDCIHVGFALALPEVNKALSEFTPLSPEGEDVSHTERNKSRKSTILFKAFGKYGGSQNNAVKDDVLIEDLVESGKFTEEEAKEFIIKANRSGMIFEVKQGYYKLA